MRIFIIVTFVINFIYAFAQSTVIPPQISYVTVNPETEKITIYWYKSPQTTVDSIQLSHVTEFNPYAGFGFAGFSKNEDSFYTFDISNLRSVSTSKIEGSYMFSIDAKVGTEWSTNLSNGHLTIYAKVSNSECNKKNNISWNGYVGYMTEVRYYNIYQYVNGSPVKIDSVSNNQNWYDHSFTKANGDFCYYIEAVLKDIKGVTRKSTSQKVCIQAYIGKSPEYLIADYASVIDDNTIELSFSVDPDADLVNKYIVVKSNDIKGPFKQIDSGAINNTKQQIIKINDKGSNIALDHNYYKIYALSKCGDTILESNIASNIILDLKDRVNNNDITWTKYLEWPEGVDRYELYRSIDDGELEKIYTTKTILNYNDFIENIARKGNKICYVVIAYPKNPKNPAAKSQSNMRCNSWDARVFVPDAFNPVSPVEKNRLFKPEVTFVSIKTYEFKVFDRWGELLYKSNNYDDVWDGKYKDKLVSEGTYIYYVKYESSNNQKLEKRGTFNVIYNE